MKIFLALLLSSSFFSQDSKYIICGPSTKPRIIYSVKAIYTDIFKRNDIEGVVLVEFRIDTSGIVLGAKIIKGLDPDLDNYALTAAYQWKFSKSDTLSTWNIPFRFRFKR